MDAELTCELGPIRPPSEAASLLLRVTRNCPWNGCAFCAVYKRVRFSRRSEEEVETEIDRLASLAKRVRERAAIMGEVGSISTRVVLDVMRDPRASDDERRVALWLHHGGRNVFLQDADSLAIRPARLARVLRHLKRRFPSIERVTTYARSRTLCARSADQLADLRDAGLTRIHVGVESGHDPLLAFIGKGARADHHVRGCHAAVAAGFEVCCYVMPGLGGRRFTEGHARDTATVLREIDPHHVRLRTLWIDRGSPLEDMERNGEFEQMEEDEIVAEIATMLAGLRGAHGHVISDHERNLLMDIEGHLTDDADRLQAFCRELLDLDRETRDAFVVARRAGHVRRVRDLLADARSLAAFKDLASDLRREGDGSLLRGMTRRLGRRSL